MLTCCINELIVYSTGFLCKPVIQCLAVTGQCLYSVPGRNCSERTAIIPVCMEMNKVVYLHLFSPQNMLIGCRKIVFLQTSVRSS